MKPVATFLVAALLTATVASADPSQPGGAPERNRAVMLYFSKSFGSTQKQNRMPLAFGLRLQQSANFDSRITIAMADLRYSLGGKAQLSTFGVRAFGADEADVDGSSSTSRFYNEHPWLAWGMTVVVAGGAACAFQLGFCGGGGSSYERPSETASPGGG